jgi:hypothetical protein
VLAGVRRDSPLPCRGTAPRPRARRPPPTLPLIEDDILVTEDGNENLSAGLPRASADVEAWMASLNG